MVEWHYAVFFTGVWRSRADGRHIPGRCGGEMVKASHYLGTRPSVIRSFLVANRLYVYVDCILELHLKCTKCEGSHLMNNATSNVIQFFSDTAGPHELLRQGKPHHTLARLRMW